MEEDGAGESLEEDTAPLGVHRLLLLEGDLHKGDKGAGEGAVGREAGACGEAQANAVHHILQMRVRMRFDSKATSTPLATAASHTASVAKGMPISLRMAFSMAALPRTGSR